MQATAEHLEPWQVAWRHALCPRLSKFQLLSLHQAILDDDPSLLQGATTSPPAIHSSGEWPCEAACLIGWLGRADGCENVNDVNDYFAKACSVIDLHLGELGACRVLLNWWDDTPRAQAFCQLLDEVNLEIARRLRAERTGKAGAA